MGNCPARFLSNPRESPFLIAEILHRSIDGQYWGITYDDWGQFMAVVNKFYVDGRIMNAQIGQPRHNPNFHDADIGPNFYQVVNHVVKPITAASRGLSWALMCHPTGLRRADVFVSHSWSEGIWEFDRCLRLWWVAHKDSIVWCCCLANPQAWPARRLEALIGDGDPQRSPFGKALCAMPERMLLIPNRQVSIYSRLWCVYEAFLAMELGIPVRLLIDPPEYNSDEMTANRFQHMVRMEALRAHRCIEVPSVTRATCSVVSDERKIRAAIQGHEDRIDEMIRGLKKPDATGRALLDDSQAFYDSLSFGDTCKQLGF